MKRIDQDVDHRRIDGVTEAITENFEKQQSALVTSTLILEDGIIDPRDTHNVLGLAPTICSDGDKRAVRPAQFSVARP